MVFRKKQSGSRIFNLQEDGHLGQVDRLDTGNIEEYLTGGLGSPSKRTQTLRCTISRSRLRFMGAVIVVVVIIFVGRAGQLQIVRGEHYRSLSDRNRNRIELIVPPRGEIHDRYGTPLAWNEPSFVLTMTISELPKNDIERRALFEHVAGQVGLQVTDLDLIMSEYISRSYDPIPVAEDIPYEAGIRLAIEVATLPGFHLDTKTKRVYNATVSSMSHVMGYTGPLSARDLEEFASLGYRPIDDIGKAGIERQVESVLRGDPGRIVYEVDAGGNRIAIVSKESALDGADISLSIDLEFQKYIETQLVKTLEVSNASRASVVAVDPATGAVRALVSWPSFDNNEFIGGISKDRYAALLENVDNPLFPRAIAGEFPSGSTFKPFIAYAALAEGVVSEHTSVVSTGGLRIGQWFFPDWKAGGHGVTDVRKAIAESVNTYFYVIGGGYDTITGLGVSRISEYAQRFGFGQQTGIDLPGEGDGFLPTKEWKEEVKGERWYVGDTYHFAIGQGDFLTTPLQMATATAAIANGGYKIQPYIVESVDGPFQGALLHGSIEPLEDLDAYALSVVRQGMRQTVTRGSARSMVGLTEAVAGKTGTAQTPGNKAYHSWFTGFAPYEDPTISLVVLIEEGGESTDAAVPLARELLQWWFNNLR
ncbi:MAG: penicillin-binding protein 2 [Parcubacteria group bacterium]|nr:penicillin-binding protein 2 [Parcubacteria group bacterium]